MNYREYFDSINTVMNDLYDDSISAADAAKHISELNQAALKSGNLVLLKFLADPQEQIKRIMDARAFENKQVENNVLDSYETSYDDESETSLHPGLDWTDLYYSHD